MRALLCLTLSIPTCSAATPVVAVKTADLEVTPHARTKLLFTDPDMIITLVVGRKVARIRAVLGQEHQGGWSTAARATSSRTRS
jgi:hypothetical protein